MRLGHSGLSRAWFAAMLALLCLVALITLLACGGEQAVPPAAATEAPAQPTDASAPTPEPAVSPTAILTPTVTMMAVPTNPPALQQSPMPTATSTSTPTPTVELTHTPMPIPTATPEPTPTATLMPTPMPSATLTPTPVPTETPEPTTTAMPPPTVTPAPTSIPEPTAAPTPTPTPTPASGEQGTTVLKREMEYTYTIELPDNWNEERESRYSSGSTSAQLTISTQLLPNGYTVDQFSQFARDDLQKDWWPNASLFEITSVEEGLTDNQPTRRIRYRVQESQQYCVLDVQESVVVAQLLPGNPQGFRIIAWMCEHDVATYGQVREGILESIRLLTKPAGYYKQFISVNGVTVKAGETVDPAAVESGAEIVAAMLSGRQDIAPCMARRKGDLAIVPRDQPLTSLPEYQHLEGTTDFTGRRRDNFDIRGVGGVRGLAVSSAAEEQLLGNLEPHHPWYPFRGLVAVHEFAHGIENLCFTQADYEQWNGFYEEAEQAELYPGSHMMANLDEYFAVMTTWYFEVTDELGEISDRNKLKERFPMVFQALDDIYGGATVPEKYRTWTDRQH